MKGELKVCAHNNHSKQHSDPHRPAREINLHFRFHKIRLYMRKGRLHSDCFDMQADLSPLKAQVFMKFLSLIISKLNTSWRHFVKIIEPNYSTKT